MFKLTHTLDNWRNDTGMVMLFLTLFDKSYSSANLLKYGLIQQIYLK